MVFVPCHTPSTMSRLVCDSRIPQRLPYERTNSVTQSSFTRLSWKLNIFKTQPRRHFKRCAIATKNGVFILGCTVIKLPSLKCGGGTFITVKTLRAGPFSMLNTSLKTYPTHYKQTFTPSPLIY